MEVHTPTGRVDIVMKTDKALYLFELKLNKSAHGQSFQLLLSHIHKSVKSNNAVILSAKLLFLFHISKLFDLFYQHYKCLV